VAGLELAHDQVAERMMQSTVDSETALAQLESAMDRADESAKSRRRCSRRRLRPTVRAAQGRMMERRAAAEDPRARRRRLKGGGADRAGT
jgi:hypothetical protein